MSKLLFVFFFFFLFLVIASCDEQGPMGAPGTPGLGWKAGDPFTVPRTFTFAETVLLFTAMALLSPFIVVACVLGIFASCVLPVPVILLLLLVSLNY